MTTTTMGREAKQDLARMLMDAAGTLGLAIRAVDGLERIDPDTVEAEADAADRVVIEGPEVMKALQALAMRLDRAALVKYHDRHERD